MHFSMYIMDLTNEYVYIYKCDSVCMYAYKYAYTYLYSVFTHTYVRMYIQTLTVP